ncbi:DUF1853 family protein [Microbulbifer halophilus]|uniref:DUF1853 family protein n=1 Tax=Microbulbifer halophilus TaxID=453963 RepID=A0ABW5EGZ5_9GAMM|nr:DUF1853 family protein [Microbulbifer halophilus]MCW8125755.1 DUF1853 family protein [Microbulbifer halophilus]
MPEPDHWNNLLWAVTAEDIARDSDLPWLPHERGESLTAYFSRTDVRERLAPELESALHRHDEQQKNTRLGAYFENLWEFAFRHHPDYELLHRNLPLRAEGRTLGELDFIVRHLPAGAMEHWEIAVKFYLQVDAEHWVGPGLRDRLDIKLARMRDHQLPIVHRAPVDTILQRLGIRIERQWTLMPGRLFRPLGEALASGAGYWWATLDTFRQAYCREPLRWAVLPKRTWLAELRGQVRGSESCDELASRLRGEGGNTPVCAAALDGGREIERGFIVPDQWHRAALERLP